MDFIDGKYWSLEECNISVAINAQHEMRQIHKLYVRDSRQMPILATELMRIHECLRATGIHGTHDGWRKELWHKSLRIADSTGGDRVYVTVVLRVDLGAIFVEITLT
jgi:hypothetical protein